MWRKWWHQAGQIDTLSRDLEFERRKCEELERMLNREEERNALLESAIKTEQKAHNLALRRYADQISKQVGLPQKFVDDVTPRPEPKPEPIDMTWLFAEAQSIRQAELDTAIDPDSVPSIDFYLEALKKNPSDIIIG